MSLRENQKKAVLKSIENNFKSGVHSHATGTGKSWIALEILLEYQKKYGIKNILWLCEQKNILKEQFDNNTLKEKGYFLEIRKKFLILNYTENKSNKWYEEVNSASKWNKSLLIIINRAFLISKTNYKKLKIDINLIIHDECHSIRNKTTNEFYDFIINKNENISCIGFSATPNIEIKPYDNVISNYSIYDAFQDDVILNPHIKWIKSDKILTDIDIIETILYLIKDLYYKKIIIWCGIIKTCKNLVKIWKNYINDTFSIFIDTSEDDNHTNYEDFKKKEKNAILFCASKHREGSDIPNLDTCVFLDKVEDRNPKTFVQCIGRVLRKDLSRRKKYGLIIDLKANSCLKLCDRVNEYLNSSINFPWKYNYYHKKINNKDIIINHLELIISTKIKKLKEMDSSEINLKDKFIIDCPNEKIYTERLEKELDILKKKKLENYLLRAVKILELTNYIPHVTRGSCGSSLVCYLLGISNIDPIKYEITFERFLNNYRDNLPDIDLDFPHFLRDEVFLKLEIEWPNQVARISNHVHWHEKSSLREALRKVGIKKKIPKDYIQEFVNNLDNDKKEDIKKIQNNLKDTFRHYSLHCGGIVFFNESIPKHLRLNNSKKIISQIIYDKNDISKEKNFKIDVLSSRGISQLMDIIGTNIDFEDCPYDEKTYKLLQDGNNIGITLAESPLMRKTLIKMKPKSIDDLAKCLAIIRPAAKNVYVESNNNYDLKFIYDDDAILILSSKLNIGLDIADKFRRCISKNKWDKKTKDLYEELLNKIDKKDKIFIIENIEKKLRKYSFCKSHSYSYAQLIYKLAYQKTHNSKKFWKSTLKNSHSSYRKWVHLYEAKLAGVDSYEMKKNKDVSVYAENRLKKINNLEIEEQMRKYGYWNMTSKEFYPNCYFYEKEKDVYYFCGLIASLKVLHYKKKEKYNIIYIGVGPSKYVEIISKESNYIKKKIIGIKGRAKVKDEQLKIYEAFICIYF